MFFFISKFGLIPCSLLLQFGTSRFEESWWRSRSSDIDD